VHFFIDDKIQTMNKDFDTWNTRKKTIDFSSKNPPYLERDIWWCSLGVNIGFEENR
jgi:tRNA1(Val) A37 N6-methylase TrmN6